MKDRVFGVLQRVGRSFMLPIAILPVAGLLLGIGGSFTNATMLETYGLMGIMGPGTILFAVFEVMSKAGDIVFSNLPIIFAMGVAIGMAKREKEVAALAAAIAFFIMNASIGAMIIINGGTEQMLSGSTASVVGITSLQMGVFGGIIVGLGVAALHNRFYRIELPQVLAFFGGTRFVPIISALVYTAVGILMFFVWPPIQRAIYTVGDLVLNSGYAGTWVYGLMERLLIPFGLHHVFYLPFWQTAVGGTMEVGGKLIEGAQNIFFAQLADPNTQQFAVSATRFMSGKFPLMIFGLPGAALAMYRTARQDKKKDVSGLLLSAALTSMLTGITEPLEFTFLFVAPLLYGIHCVFAGLAYMLMHIFKVGVGMTFSGGLIDMFLFGILQGNAKTNWVWIVIVGIGYFIVYYFLFSFLIRRLDLKTPGRDDSEEVKLYRRSDVEARKNGGAAEAGSAMAGNGAAGAGSVMAGNGATGAGSRGIAGNGTVGADSSGIAGNGAAGTGSGLSEADALSSMICRGLGGKSNISDVDCCATRLRCTVFDADKVDDGLLKSTGASGVIHKGTGVQVIYGPRVAVIKSNLEDYLDTVIETYDEDDRVIESDILKEKERDIQKEDGDSVRGNVQKKNTAENAFGLLTVIHSPISGVAADLATAPDEAFAGGMMGQGAVVTPTDPVVRAPEDGTVSFVFDTKHAIGFETDSGITLLIHVGIDTVALKGQGFEALVKTNQKVKRGMPMLRLDLDFVKEHAPSLASPVVCTELAEGQKIRLLRQGEVQAGEELFEVVQE